jgi:hypothetical protein
MQSFLTRHQSEIKGTLSGFDRVRFRGTLRWLANVSGLGAWLFHAGILLKQFKDYAMGLTNTIRDSTRRIAEAAERPLQYVASSTQRKEDLAREIAERDGVTVGLVCVLSCVEPCPTFTVGPNRERKTLELRKQQGKCLHDYFYLIDPKLGWLNVRLQTWFPFTVHVVINGREWLARELIRKDIPFERRENCFTDIADVATAQHLLQRQRRTNWSRELDRLLRGVHPAHRTLFGENRLDYYWSADETEWTTDVLFRSEDDLTRLYPRLVRHALTTFGRGVTAWQTVVSFTPPTPPGKCASSPRAAANRRAPRSVRRGFQSACARPRSTPRPAKSSDGPRSWSCTGRRVSAAPRRRVVRRSVRCGKSSRSEYHSADSSSRFLLPSDRWSPSLLG